MADPKILRIADQVASLIRDAGTRARVIDFGRAHQIREDELPAISIELGAEAPTDPDGQAATSYIDAFASLYVDIYESVADGEALRTIEHVRAEVHRALMADETLGLSFVHQIHYQGAEDPITDPDGGDIFYSRRMIWAVEFRFARTDPAS